MTDQSLSLAVKPIIRYPREAQVGRTYLMTIDLQPEEGLEWQYEEEEYPVHCKVDSEIFSSKPIGEPVVVLHRFGGNYGEARFLLTAALEAGKGKISVILINAWGVPFKVVELEQVQLLPTEIIHSETEFFTETELRETVSTIPKVEEEEQKVNETDTACAIIFTSLPVEYLAVRSYLTEIRQEATPQGTIYERGKFAANNKIWDVGIVEIGVGNTSSVLESERAIAYFDPDIILFVGIAGGIKDVSLGDVVASTKVYGYESGKMEETFRPRPETELSDDDLVQLARAEARKADWLQRLASVPSPAPKVYVAPIAAGERVIASTKSEVFKFLRSNYGDAIAVEMEGFSSLDAARANQQVSALVIRGISDLIYNKTEEDKEGYQEIAARHASAFAFELLTKYRLKQSSGAESSPEFQARPLNFFALDDRWVGRSNLIQDLSHRIQESCRLLILVGMTGIGKTALGERLAVELEGWFDGDWSRFHQENFEDEQQSSDFASVAARWLEKWGELITPEDRKDPQRLLYRLVRHLCENRYLVHMDSLQNILQCNEEEGWNDFKDEWWTKFFDSYLRAESCESCLILTSQDLPGQIEEIGARSQKFWYCQPLNGLEKSEQIALFEKTELDVSANSTSRAYLERIGSAYEGHPLALRVIAGEIKNEPFKGNVVAYWNSYGSEVEEVEKAIAEAQEGKSTGADDKWKLDRFTKTLRRNVRSRLNKTFARLKEDAKWAYILLCESSVYRCPVPEDFWLSHLEDWDRDEEEQRAALDILRDRYLVEELIGNNSQHLLRQHNLVRSVALERLKFIDNTENVLDEKKFKILEELNSCFTNFDLKEIEPKQLSSATPRGSYREIVNWLNLYQPGVNSSKIERVRGYLEAFRHFCDLADWENANRIISLQVNTSTSQKLLEQLGTWGYYGEQISLCEKLLGRLNQTADFRLRSCLGNAAYIHGNYDLAIQYFQQSLQVANQSDERNEMAAALNSLGTVYNVLGNYGQAIEYYQQALSITREIGNRLEEGYTLGNLGLAYNFLGNYEQAVAYCQQALTISREIGDRHSEENMLGNLGIAYASLANYSQAVEYHQYQLTIAREIGDRRGEAIALSRLGSCLINLHQYSDSLSYLETALQTFNEIGDRANQASSLKALAELYQGLGQLDTALQCAEQALNIATELGIPLVQEIQNLEALIREA